MHWDRGVAVTGSHGPGSGCLVGPRLVLTAGHVGRAEGRAVSVLRPGRAGECARTVVWCGTPDGRDDAALVLLDDPHWVPTGEAAPRGAPSPTAPASPAPGGACRTWCRARTGPWRSVSRPGGSTRGTRCSAIAVQCSWTATRGRSVAVGRAVRRRRVLHSCWPSINHHTVSSPRGRRTVSGSLPAGDLHVLLEAVAGGRAGCGRSRAVQLSMGRRLPA